MFDIAHLKRRRLLLGMTQSAFAKEAGVSQSLITKIEAGRIDPKHSSVRRIEEALLRMERNDTQTAAGIAQRHIISAMAQEQIPHLIARMQRQGISQVPVMDGKHVIGIITESTILETISAGKDIRRLTAAQIMEAAPPILPASTPLSTCAALLEHIPLLLVQEKGSLGIVTKSDVIRAKLK